MSGKKGLKLTARQKSPRLAGDNVSDKENSTKVLPDLDTTESGARAWLRERGARKRGKTEKLSKDENKYLKSLELHRKYVREAGVALGLPEGIYLSHDLSKFWPEEFFAYADWFYGKKSDPEAYDRAWLHHLHNNPHHWQYWVMPPEFNPDGDHDNGCLEMPEEYVLEMIADWLGANKAYQDTWDMTPWLKENFGKIRMHQKSKDFLVKKLRELGYGAVLDEVEK